MGRLGVALVGLAATTALMTPAAASAPVQTLVLRFAYDGPAHGQLEVVGNGAVSADAFLAWAEVIKTDHSKARLEGGVTDLAQLNTVATYGLAGSADVCPGTPACAPAEAREFTFSLGTDASLFGPGHVHLEYYLVLHAADLHVHIHSLQGWRPQPGSDGVHRVLDRTAQDTGAEASIFNAGIVLSAHAAGYNNGSIAIAPADCDVAGEGFLKLTGGASVATTHCGSDPAVALATGATTWHADGVTAGIGHDATRLLVIAL